MYIVQQQNQLEKLVSFSHLNIYNLLYFPNKYLPFCIFSFINYFFLLYLWNDYLKKKFFFKM